MRDEKTEGIVLRSLEYKDRQRIITVFTAECGLISLIVKGISHRSQHLWALTSPFCQAEFHFARGRSNLFRFIDGTVTEDHLSLRQKFSFLQTAGSMANAILRSQLPEKPSPTLFALFCAYLKQAALFEEPQALTASFLLKMLKHEGLLALNKHCLRCGTMPSSHLEKGESLCQDHAPSHALYFSDEEWTALFQLASAQQFRALQQLKIAPSLSQKISQLFDQRMTDNT